MSHPQNGDAAGGNDPLESASNELARSLLKMWNSMQMNGLDVTGINAKIDNIVKTLMKEKDHEVIGLKSQLARANDRNELLENRLKDGTESFTAAVTEKNRLQFELNAAKTDLAKVQADGLANQSRIKDLEDALAEKARTLTDTKSAVDKRQIELQHKTDALSQLTIKHDALKKEHASLMHQYGEEKRKSEQSDSEVKRLTREMEQNTRQTELQAANFKTDLELARKELETERAQHIENRRKMDSLEIQLKTSSEQKQVLQSTFDLARQKIDLLQTNAADEKEKLQKSEQLLSGAQQELKVLKERTEENEKNLNIEIKKLKDALAEAASNITAVQGEKVELRRNLEAKEIENTRLTSDMKKKTDKFVKIKDSFEQVDEENVRLFNDQKTVSERAKNYKSDLDKKGKSIERLKNSLKESRQQTTNEQTKLQQHLDQCKTEKEAFAHEREDWKIKLIDLDAQTKIAKLELEKETEKRAQFEENCKKVTTAFEAFQKKATDLEIDFAKAKLTIESMTKDKERDQKQFEIELRSKNDALKKLREDVSLLEVSTKRQVAEGAEKSQLLLKVNLENTSLTAAIQTKTESLTRTEQKLDLMTAEYNKLQQTMQKESEKSVELRTLLAHLERDHQKLQREMQQLVDENARVKNATKVDENQLTILRLQQVENVSKSAVDEGTKNAAMMDIQKKGEEIRSLNVQLTSLREELQKLTAAYQVTQHNFTISEEKMVLIRSANEGLEKSLESEKQNGIKQAERMNDALAKANEEIANFKRRFEDEKSSHGDTKRNLESKTVALTNVTQANDELKSKLINLKNQHEKLVQEHNQVTQKFAKKKQTASRLEERLRDAEESARQQDDTNKMEVEDLRTERAKLAAKNDELNKEVSDKATQLFEAGQKVEKMTTELQSKTALLSDVENNFKTVSLERQNLIDALATNKDKITTKDQEIFLLGQEMQNLKSKVGEQAEKSKAAADDHQRIVDLMKEENEKAQTHRRELKNDIKIKRELLSDAKKSIENVSSKLQETVKENAQLQEEVKKLKSAKSEILINKHNLEENVADQEKRLFLMDAEMTTLKSQLQEHKDRATNESMLYHSSTTDERMKADKFKQDSENIGRQYLEAKQRIDILTLENRSMFDALGVKKAELIKLSDVNGKMQDNLAELKAEKDTSRHNLLIIENHLKEAQGKWSEARSELEAAENRFKTKEDKLSTEIEKLNTSMKTKKDEILEAKLTADKMTTLLSRKIEEIDQLNKKYNKLERKYHELSVKQEYIQNNFTEDERKLFHMERDLLVQNQQSKKAHQDSNIKISELKTEQKRLLVDIRHYSETIKERDNQLAEMKEYLRSMTCKVEYATEHLERTKEELNTTQRKNEKLEKRLEHSLEKSRNDDIALNQLTAELSGMKNQLAKLRSDAEIDIKRLITVNEEKCDKILLIQLELKEKSTQLVAMEENLAKERERNVSLKQEMENNRLNINMEFEVISREKERLQNTAERLKINMTEKSALYLAAQQQIVELNEAHFKLNGKLQKVATSLTATKAKCRELIVHQSDLENKLALTEENLRQTTDREAMFIVRNRQLEKDVSSRDQMIAITEERLQSGKEAEVRLTEKISAIKADHAAQLLRNHIAYRENLDEEKDKYETAQSKLEEECNALERHRNSELMVKAELERQRLQHSLILRDENARFEGQRRIFSEQETVLRGQLTEKDSELASRQRKINIINAEKAHLEKIISTKGKRQRYLAAAGIFFILVAFIFCYFQNVTNGTLINQLQSNHSNELLTINEMQNELQSKLNELSDHCNSSVSAAADKELLLMQNLCDAEKFYLGKLTHCYLSLELQRADNQNLSGRFVASIPHFQAVYSCKLVENPSEWRSWVTTPCDCECLMETSWRQLD